MGFYGQTINIRSPFFAPLSDDETIARQAVEMRLDTSRGLIWTDPDYGLSVPELLGEGMTPAAVAHLAEQVRAEVEKDERFVRVEMSGTTTLVGGRASIAEALRVVRNVDDVPSMTMPIGDVTVEKLTRGA